MVQRHSISDALKRFIQYYANEYILYKIQLVSMQKEESNFPESLYVKLEMEKEESQKQFLHKCIEIYHNGNHSIEQLRQHIKGSEEKSLPYIEYGIVTAYMILYRTLRSRLIPLTYNCEQCVFYDLNKAFLEAYNKECADNIIISTYGCGMNQYWLRESSKNCEKYTENIAKVIQGDCTKEPIYNQLITRIQLYQRNLRQELHIDQEEGKELTQRVETVLNEQKYDTSVWNKIALSIYDYSCRI